MPAPAFAFHAARPSPSWQGGLPVLNQYLSAGDLRDETLRLIADVDARSATERWACLLGYDLGRLFEDLPARGRDATGVPWATFATGQWSNEPFVPGDVPPAAATRVVGSTFDRRGYERAVQRCLDYIAAGDIFQVNLSQQLRVPTGEPPWQIYRRLQRTHPAAYGAYFDDGVTQYISNSPELFLRVTKLPDGRRKIVNRPIKGTRRNAPGMAAELLGSAKDRAELAMIVDLQRNDLGRICETGSVIVSEPRTIETHPTVLHGVATVEGVLRDGASLLDILRATFPCGSITGCPKIRAMQIIDELEPVGRGAYCGAIGWIHGGEMELSVAIRTMTLRDGVAIVPVGGGIVADSDPAAEYEETLVKARAMLGALGVRD